MSEGFVSLVGAGPGDRELISIKGWSRLQEADIVFYDYLVNERLLNACKEKCETIYVGKSANHHHYTQDRINECLVEEAHKGKKVVRLKGGDPFVFGRGSEEMLVLKEAGISFEVIPGITAAVAGPAYAGVPLTHRELSLSCTFITGHEARNKEYEYTDWHNLAGNMNTLIFYMGLKNIEKITANLIEHGREENTSALVIQNGSMGIQKTVTGTLKDISPKVREANIASPAIIVVGGVASLRDSLKWFENLPLFGKVMAFVGHFNSHEKALDHCEAQGARILELPYISSSGLECEPRFRARMLIERGEMDYLIFESLSSFNAFTKNHPDCHSQEWLSQFTLGTLDKDLKKILEGSFQSTCHLVTNLGDFLQDQ